MEEAKTMKLRALATLVMFLPSSISYLPPPVAAYLPNGSGGANPVSGASGTALTYVPSEVALYCSTDGSGTAGTWAPCNLGATPSSVKTGTASNTDTAGQLTLVAGTATYPFTGTYTVPPICTASDTSAQSSYRVSTTTTTLTLNGTGSDVLNYICVPRT